MAVFGPTRPRSSAASWSQSFSASGSGFTEILFQDQLRRHRVDGFLVDARIHPAVLELAFRLDRRESLVYSRDRQAETAFELSRELFYSADESVLALLRDRQSDHQPGRMPLAHEARD